MPFIVHFSQPGGQEGDVEVLGTHFNVNAYGDEGHSSVTLLEGKVRVSASSPSKGMESITIHPGQQAQVAEQIAIVNKVDVQQVMAWKNGLFSFDHADIKTIMQQISRWYDVEVVYEGSVPDIRFKGKMDRAVKLSGVIRFLHDYGIQAQLNGRTLTIQTK